MKGLWLGCEGKAPKNILTSPETAIVPALLCHSSVSPAGNVDAVFLQRSGSLPTPNSTATLVTTRSSINRPRGCFFIFFPLFDLLKKITANMKKKAVPYHAQFRPLVGKRIFEPRRDIFHGDRLVAVLPLHCPSTGTAATYRVDQISIP